jgi:prevent-host-death family protein
MSLVSVSEASQNLSHWINQASYGRECVIVTSRGRAKAVLIGVEAFEALIGVPDHTRRESLPVQQLRSEFNLALAEAGYGTPEQVVNLVREVKRELADEPTTDHA